MSSSILSDSGQEQPLPAIGCSAAGTADATPYRVDPDPIFAATSSGSHVRPATPGDHPAIHYFLQSIFRGPSAGEFQAQLEDPLYEPTSRLVVRRNHQILAHVRLINRALRFGESLLPITYLADLATLPEHRHRGHATALLAAAERQMRDEGAVLGRLRTAVPRFYRKRGWTVCGRHSYSTARPRDILSFLSSMDAARVPVFDALALDPGSFGEPRRPLSVRLWRHVERAALIRLYDENTPGAYGPLRRTEDYWRWLISRRGYDRIYVAIDGPDKLELDESFDAIVGYAAMKEGRIVELTSSPAHPRAAIELLARACRDAIERDHHTVRLDAPPDDPLHQIVSQAGGRHCYHEAENGEVFMVKLFDPLGFLLRLCPQLHRRAKAARLARPCELGLAYQGEKYCLQITGRDVKLKRGRLGRSYLTCGRNELTQLLLGHVAVNDRVASGRLDASTHVAAEIASVLFPKLPIWHPPLDDLSA